MADLMNGVYTYKSLADKYGNFCTPAVKISVDGNKVFPGSTGVTDLNVSLSVGSASSVTFTIAGAYDRSVHSFQAAIKNTFGLGKKVEVELGYMSETTPVFKGFIVSVNMDFSDTPTLSVTAMDARRLMMQSGEQAKKHEGKKYSDIAGTVMSPYGHLCSLTQEDTTGELTEPVDQKTNDYHFMTEVLGKVLNREFLILGDKAYFREPKSQTTAMIILQFGYSLLSFRRKADYLYCNITAVGHDQEQGATISATENVIVNQTTRSGTQTPTEIIVCEAAGSVGELTVRAGEAARKKKDAAQTAGGKCVGLPEIVPGRFIELTDLDSTADGKYYIKQVNHSFGPGGFFTNFDVEGFE